MATGQIIFAPDIFLNVESASCATVSGIFDAIFGGPTSCSTDPVTQGSFITKGSQSWEALYVDPIFGGGPVDPVDPLLGIDWSSPAQVLQALLIVALLFAFVSGYRNGDKL